MINPLEDMVAADWSPFEHPKWNMPLLTDLSDWRMTLKEMEEELGDDIDVTFVADFPGEICFWLQLLIISSQQRVYKLISSSEG